MQTLTPRKVEADFDSHPVKVVLDPNHSAVITKSGSLYTFGKDKNGCLGHN